MKKISVIIPVYNAEKYLTKCLNSIVNQTYTNLEIILVNDGSKDSSLNICYEYKKKDDRIKVINNDNHGASYSRNCGISISTGEYIMFIDADDYIENNFIERLITCNEYETYDLFISCYTDFYDKNIFKEKKLIDENILTFDLKKDYLNIVKYLRTPWGKIYKLNIIKENNIKFPEDYITAEDQIFNFRYLKYIKKYRFLNECLYFYRHENKNSLSSSKSYEAFISNIKKLKFEKVFLDEMNIENKEKIMGDDAVELIGGYVFLSNESIFNYFNYKKRLKLIKSILENKYDVTNDKKNLILKFLKYNIIFPIYVYYLLNYIKKR